MLLGICIIALLLQTVVSAFNVEKVIGIDINSETFCNAFIRSADKVFYSDIYNKTLKSKTLELEEKVTDHTGGNSVVGQQSNYNQCKIKNIRSGCAGS